MTLQLLHSEFPYIWGKFDFFLSVHRGVLSFLVLERCSGHRRHHVMGQLSVVGCEAVHPGMHPLLVRHARFGMGTSSLHSLLRNRQLKKALFSCSLGQRYSISAVASMVSRRPAGWRAVPHAESVNIHQLVCSTMRWHNSVYGFAGSGTVSTRVDEENYCRQVGRSEGWQLHRTAL